MALRELQCPWSSDPPQQEPATQRAHPCGIQGRQVPGAGHLALCKFSISAACLLLPSQWQAGDQPEKPSPSHLSSQQNCETCGEAGEASNPKAGLAPCSQAVPLHPITRMGPSPDGLSTAVTQPALQDCFQPPPPTSLQAASGQPSSAHQLSHLLPPFCQPKS